MTTREERGKVIVVRDSATAGSPEMRVPQIQARGRQVLGVQPLHHDDDGSGALVVEAGREGLEEEVHGPLSLGFALGLDGIVRVIDDDAIAAFSGGRAADRRRGP